MVVHSPQADMTGVSLREDGPRVVSLYINKPELFFVIIPPSYSSHHHNDDKEVSIVL